MRIKTRSAAVALVAIYIGGFPSLANEDPYAQIVGYQCGVVRTSGAPVDMPSRRIMACQIGEDGDPFSGVRLPRGETVPTLDSLRHSRSILDNARREAPRSRRGAFAPRPTP